MTLMTLLLAWTAVSIVTSLAMGRWLGGRDLIDHFVSPLQFRLDDD